MKRKILVIEDDFNVLENITALLLEEKYDVLGARNGMEGFTCMKTFHPDLILCDVAMPLLDGLELLKLIHTDKVNFDKPFIFLSAKTTRENIREGMTLGADDYLTKPFNRKEILDAISTRLNRAEVLEDKTNQLRESVVFSLPHEILTPLNAIYLGSDLLQQGDSSLSIKEINEFGELIFKSATMLKDVFTKYLYLLELFVIRSDANEQARLAAEICKFPDRIIKQTSTNKAEEYNRKDDLTLKVDSGVLKISDKHFAGIIRELLDNAFKFSEQGSAVTVLGGISFSDYLLSVKSIGQTMTGKQISMIGEFMRFGKDKNATGGLGLGLAIVKNTCENYEVDFDVSSTSNSVTVNCRFKVRK